MFEDLNPKPHYFVRKHCSSQWKLADTQIPFWDLTFVEQGKAIYHTSRDSMIIREGQAVFLPKGSFRSAETTGMACIAFSFQLSEGEALSLPSQFSWNHDYLLLQYFQDFEREWLQQSSGSSLKCKGIFLLILHRVMELLSAEKPNRYVDSIKQILSQRLSERITVKQIAESVGLSPVYCGAIFRESTGMTILEYANRIRINKAASLLEYGKSSVAETAAQTGFEDVFYFSRVFKKYLGVSPAQYLNKK